MAHRQIFCPTDAVPARAVLEQMIVGAQVTQMIYAAVKLGLIDSLADGPRHCDKLAASVEANSHALYRLLRGLASLGIFAEVEDRRFELTPQATHLQENAPGSLCLPALLAGATWCWQSRGELLYSVRTGKPAFERIFGMSIFDYFAQDAEAAETFHNAMSTSAGAVSTVVLNACDFSGVDRLVDVGGGSGKLIAAIMKANPRLRGVLFDVPSAIEDARDFVAGEGVADRCEFVAGDFFDGPIPSGDVHVLSRVIHDWDDDCAVTILENCRRGMPDDGRLLIVESVIPPGNAPSPAKLRDLDMLVMWGGRERTEEEFRALFDASGFKLTDVVLRHFPISVVEGVPT